MSSDLFTILLDRGQPLFWLTAIASAAGVSYLVARTAWRRRGGPRTRRRRLVPPPAPVAHALRAYRAEAGGSAETPAALTTAGPPAAGVETARAAASPGLSALVTRLQTAVARLESLSEEEAAAASPGESAQPRALSNSLLKPGLEGVDYVFRNDD